MSSSRTSPLRFQADGERADPALIPNAFAVSAEEISVNQRAVFYDGSRAPSDGEQIRSTAGCFIELCVKLYSSTSLPLFLKPSPWLKEFMGSDSQ
ncbi:hypothetical protein AMEX_G23468 [Astyanax mexicanus]|uniref:Uncharacterized protein n=1 Tax=Astyanax mexicanus TaxID=7994 RepID=A0A8T2L337_ASTMX|nr:hypothetical protein AMEX_G23468 [Astyanax mexicanus]